MNLSPKTTAATQATEIVLIETPPQGKKQYFVKETEKKPEDVDNLKDAADMLSQFTKRVKKQIRAQKDGPTVNAAPKASKVAALQQRQNDDEGIGRPRENSIRNVAIGQSSSEFIPGIEEGSFTALNTDQLTYYTFYERMHGQVRPRWVNNVRNFVARQSPEQLNVLARYNRTTRFEIVLGPDGSFFSSLIHRSSGDKELDRITVQAFRDAAPFPNPPRGMIENDGMIHLYYEFTIYFRPSFGPAG